MIAENHTEIVEHKGQEWCKLKEEDYDLGYITLGRLGQSMVLCKVEKYEIKGITKLGVKYMEMGTRYIPLTYENLNQKT